MRTGPITKKEIEEYKQELEIGDWLLIIEKIPAEGSKKEVSVKHKMCLDGKYPFIATFHDAKRRASFTWAELVVMRRSTLTWKEEAVRLRKRGMTMKDIARDVGMSRASVQRVLARAGV